MSLILFVAILRLSTSTTAINCDQFAKILEDKLSPLNLRIKSVDEALNHVEFVNAKYDELLQMMKTSNDERKALRDENKILQDENEILKATTHCIERSLESVTRASHNLEQYTSRECVEIRGIPVAANPSEEQTNNIAKDVGKQLGVDITENDISVSHRMPQSQQRKGKPGPPATIVKFMGRDVKDNFYRARKQLKDLTTQDLGYSEKNKIYLAESLTERNRMLFKDC